MKKITKIIITAAIIGTMNLSALAAEIPGESVPPHVTVNQIAITENLISPILCEVENGLGYGEANGKAKRIVWNAIVSGQTNGYGYGDLMAIARNAIHQQRDMYLRPEFYKEAEAQMQIVIADLIKAVEDGTLTYEEARKQSYIKILQWVEPTFTTEDMQGDFCYWDIPPIDTAYFNRARKLLLEAQTRRQIQ